jgi:hypothetical protein
MDANGNWSKVINSSANATKMLGIAMGSSQPTSGVLLKGFVRSSTYNFNAGQSGFPLYISSTAGVITTSVGQVGSGDYARLLGYVINTSTDVVYFNPEPTWIIKA